MERLRSVLVAGALAVVASVVVAGPAGAAKGGNNDTAKACQQGGWQTLVPNLGDRFANQGDCVNDGAKGSAPFGAAGKAACTDRQGINGSGVDGTFESGNGHWTCLFMTPVGTDPDPLLQALQTACATDRGSFDPGQFGVGDFASTCMSF